MVKVKALVMVSGGLDSSLVLKILEEQGIELLAVSFAFPSFTVPPKSFAQKLAEDLQIPFLLLPLGEDYLKIVRHPKHGHGRGVNPCIDCKIYMLSMARKLLEKHQAQFVATGEVLGQRPMSQHRQALDMIERESGLTGKLLRPLSAQLLPETQTEKEGGVRREKLFAISGRSRSEQTVLARHYHIEGYPTPAGGCFLTQAEFAKKLRDLLQHRSFLKWDEVLLLKVGRHFRLGEAKFIIGRNKEENALLLQHKTKADYSFEVKKWMGPITLLQGKKTPEAIQLAAQLTLLYSDCKEPEAEVGYEKEVLQVAPLSKEAADKLNVCLMG